MNQNREAGTPITHSMPTVFRIIRKRLLGEDKMFRYLKYALGEIILVVLGILIALEVNNYNEGQKALKKERDYLEKIHGNIDFTNLELERVIHDTDYWLKINDSLWHVIDSGDDSISNEQLLRWIMDMADFTINSANNSTTSEIIANGELYLISDPFIRKLMANWQGRLHNLEKYELECQFWARSYNKIINEELNLHQFFVLKDTLTFPSKDGSRQKLLRSNLITNNLNVLTNNKRALYHQYKQEKALLDSASVRIQELLKTK